MLYHPASDRTYTSVSEFLKAHPNTSFGPMGTEAERRAMGLHRVLNEPPPHDHELEYASPLRVAPQGEEYILLYEVLPRPLDEAERAQILERRFDAALTAHLDAVAAERRYDNRVTCALRASYPGPFQAEGSAFAQWMDQCNALAYQILAEVQAGQRPPPVSVEAFLGELPVMEWPQ